MDANWATTIWLSFGLICIGLEFTTLPGIGLLFLGLGGLLNSILVHNYLLLHQYQYISFGFSSFLCFAILWWPLKKYAHANNDTNHNFNIIGDTVEICALPSAKSNLGQVRWSGTIMNARFDILPDQEIKLGDLVVVQAVDGNILMCHKLKIQKK